MDADGCKVSGSHGHVLVMTCPLQGHAAPLIKLSHRIAEYGVKVSFVSTEFSSATLSHEIPDSGEGMIRLVSVPDGLDPENDRKDLQILSESIRKVMPAHLEDLLNKASDKVTSVILDSPLGFLLEIPKKMGIKTAVYLCSTPGCLALGLNISKLIEAKVIDTDGTPLKNENIQVVPNLPAMSTAEFTWYHPQGADKQKIMFVSIKEIFEWMINSDWIICNWFTDLAPSASILTTNIFPVGPLLANGQSAGSLYSEDSSCLTWLDKQAPKSVIYVAFGSTSRFSQQQVEELALGLELMNRPFLWVAWSGLGNGSFALYSSDFSERVAKRGKIVEWAPQEMVLAHPSIACFVTHCGWNSTMESVSVGVPFLCWPYFGDQLYTQTCISDGWEIGLLLNADEKGIISGYEIKRKVEDLLSDDSIRANSLKLKEMARNSISIGGSSTKNLEFLVSLMKQ
ncbi:UDP-glycosyltransferase 83A1-like [Nicotiana tabacum]|uniref:UDP-glycosyltransferase 83A1-like n=1 Tax=Nicotiana tabacum TaxID=4097 RepID=A0AC58UDZ1_TOBAC